MTAIQGKNCRVSHSLPYPAKRFMRDFDKHAAENTCPYTNLKTALEEMMKNSDNHSCLNVVSNVSADELLWLINAACSPSTEPSVASLLSCLTYSESDCHNTLVELILCAIVKHGILSVLPKFIKIIRLSEIHWIHIERIIRLYVQWLSVAKIKHDDEHFSGLMSFANSVWLLDVNQDCKRHLMRYVMISLMTKPYSMNVMYAALISQAPLILVSQLMEDFITTYDDAKLLILFNNLLMLWTFSERTTSVVVGTFIRLSFHYKKTRLLVILTESCFYFLVSDVGPSCTVACAEFLSGLSALLKSSDLNGKLSSFALPNMKPFLQKFSSDLPVHLLLVFLYEWKDLFPPIVRSLEKYSAIKDYHEEKLHGLDYPLPRNDRIGLYNPRNLCYMNSVIQCLFSCNRFRNKILRSDIDESKHVTFSVRRCFAYMTFSERRTMDVSTMMKSTLPFWFTSGQQDASEYFNYVVDTINEECPDVMLDVDKTSDLRESGVGKLFGGKFLLKTKCLECEQISESNDLFTIVYLTTSEQQDESKKTAGGSDLTEFECCHSVTSSYSNNAHAAGTAVSISGLLQGVYVSEKLTGTNLYECKSCKKKVEAIKETILTDCPFYIPLVVNSYDLSSSSSTSMSSLYFAKARIKILLEKTIMLKCHSKSTTKKFENVSYNLVSVIVHAGSYVKSGHYYCYSQAENGNWWRLNDEYFRIVSFEEMCHDIEDSHIFTSPYLLIYGRSDTPKNALEFKQLNETLKNDILLDNEQFQKSKKKTNPTHNGDSSSYDVCSRIDTSFVW